MAKLVVVFLCLSTILLLGTCHAGNAKERKDYIVYMGAIPNDDLYLPTAHHVSLLQEVTGSSNNVPADYLIRSYKRSFNGFAAKLTDNEAQKLSGMENVVSIFPSTTLHLHTTRSWDFMGFNDSTIKAESSAGSDIIIGVIDSGIWPESPSFSDEGFGPVPKRWKGVCKGGANFYCNKKLIGARFYGVSPSARDYEGHGSHTASTAGGNKVKDTSFYGLAKGTARGGFPSARIAAYKVCGAGGCPLADILAAFDDAIADGVDIITLSAGVPHAVPLGRDVVSIGGYHATAKGIVVTNSAGNDGPRLGSTGSTAPWLVTVAASTTDRLFIDEVVLGNGKTLSGFSVNSFSLNGTKYLLAYGKDVQTSHCPVQSAQLCMPGCLDQNKVKGKILLCDSLRGLTEAFNMQAAGTISPNSIVNISFVVPLPALSLSSENYAAIKSYLSSDKTAEAEILKSETIIDSSAPVVAFFSSRGPNKVISDILKPDISAPGVDILAAFSPVVKPSDGGARDGRRVGYSVMSGTSMSCPHVAGVAAYIKSLHPDWSPSAIKSAIMTTARPMNPNMNSDAAFAYGSGHIDPVKASDPGLVYDSSTQDFINMFCGLGFTDVQIKTITGSISKCEEKTAAKDLNYPSLSAVVKASEAFTVKFHRRVTNVGSSNATYEAKVLAATKSKLRITVTPNSLSFKSLNETKTYDVTVNGQIADKEVESAEIQWSDGVHVVRSPIVVYNSRS